MITENEMKELKIAAAATRDARAVAFEVFLAADSDFYAALKALNSAIYYEEKD